MRVALVSTPALDQSPHGLVPVGMDELRPCPPYAVYLLAAVLREAGHTVVVDDLVARGSARLACDLSEVDLLAVSAGSLSWPTALDVLSQARAIRPSLPVVVGGVHPTLFDAWLVHRWGVDAVVRGEGETALLSICAAYERGEDLGAVPAVTWRAPDGTAVRNPTGPKLSVDALLSAPVPAFDLLPEGVYGGLALETSRGCGFDCSFCSTPYRRSWRALPALAVAERLAAIDPHLARTHAGTVHIVDDEFSLQPQRAVDIAAACAARGLAPRLFYDSRAPDLLHPGFLQAMQPLTAGLLVGAECGYDEGLVRVGKGTTCAGLEAAAAALAAADMAARTDFSFILGLPWETLAEVRRTIAFAAGLCERYGVRILCNWYAQIPGSHLWDEARRDELVHEAMYDRYGFAGDVALFRSGVRLPPSEVWEACGELAAHRDRLGADLVEVAVPWSIARWFPRAAPAADVGTVRLRELARPEVPVGLPERRLR